MKALKEKRLSLRSFFRRGLVILSLFALVFASCNDGSSTTDPTDPTNPVVPPAKVPVSIEILDQPSNPSYQGMAPDITGVKIRVLWSTGGYEELGGDLRAQGFYPSPDYCDEPGKGWDGTTAPECDRFYMSYAGIVVTNSEELKIPGVYWLQEIKASEGPAIYADDVPDLTSVKLDLRYAYYEDKDRKFENPSTATVGGTGTDKVVFESKDRTVNAAYPPFRFTPQQTGYKVPNINVVIGALKQGEVDTVATTTDAAAITFTSSTNAKVATIKLKDFYQVTGIKWAGQDDSEFYFFDDDLEYALGDEKYIGGDTTNGKSPEKFLADFVERAKLTFQVSYSNGETKTKNWKQFKDNVQYAYSKKGILLSTGDIFFSKDVATSDPNFTMIPTSYTAAQPSKVLKYNEDNDNKWSFWMQYVPKEFLEDSAAGYAYLSLFPVDVPVYTFAGRISVARAKGYPTNVRQDLQTNPTSYGGPTGTSTMSEDLIAALGKAWVLTATYQYGKATKTKDIGLTSQMFNNGVASVGTYIKLESGDGDDGTLSARAAGVTSAVLTNRNYPLPLYYRGEDNDTVVIDVFYKFP